MGQDEFSKEEAFEQMQRYGLNPQNSQDVDLFVNHFAKGSNHKLGDPYENAARAASADRERVKKLSEYERYGIDVNRSPQALGDLAFARPQEPTERPSAPKSIHDVSDMNELFRMATGEQPVDTDIDRVSSIARAMVIESGIDINDDDPEMAMIKINAPTADEFLGSVRNAIGAKMQRVRGDGNPNLKQLWEQTKVSRRR